jgi:parallel beta-helix repeat protein
VIDGFTITNGFGVRYDYNGDGDIWDWSEDNGGGIICYDNSSPTITGCTISGNTAGYGGGGIFCYDGSNPTITGCTISGNTANNDGGGIYCSHSSNPTITGCTISDNTADYGGGIRCYYSSPAITYCTISGNTTTTFYGGGIYCYYSDPTISGCTISDNTAGGIYCRDSSPTITDCTISDNTTSGYGGGIYCRDDRSPTITGCTISDNTAGSGGGIRCYYDSSPTLTDTVVCGNNPNQIGGSVDDNGGNCIEDDCDDCEFELPDEPAGQDEEPEYGEEDAPSGGAKIVLVTHGMRTWAGDFVNGGWGTQLINAIDAHVGDDWAVWAIHYGYWPTPGSASFAADIYGHAWGTRLAWLPFDHVHLIGHSAGAYFLDACSARIKALSPSTTVHLTYLDPAEVFDWSTRGVNADFAENYYSREPLALFYSPSCDGFTTTVFTQQNYDSCVNIDISGLDPDYATDCFSSHGWPHCFYRQTAGATGTECDILDGDYLPFGLGLARESFDTQADWEAAIEDYEDGSVYILPTRARGGAGGPGGPGGRPNTWIDWARLDPPLNLQGLTSVSGGSGSGSVTVNGSSVRLSSPSPSDSAWINFEVDLEAPVNYVALTFDVGADAGAVGLTSVLLDGSDSGWIDERHVAAAGEVRVFGSDRVLPPGGHILSVRLDTIYQSGSTTMVEQIQTGLHERRAMCSCDISSVEYGDGYPDGMVGQEDLTSMLNRCWGPCDYDCAQSSCPGDIDFDCRVGVLDLLELLMSWGDCE